jgi:hypothetical protein
LNIKRAWRVPVCVLLVTLPAGLWWLLHHADQSPAWAAASQAVPYKILNDDNGDSISIGVQANVNEQQLRSTLVTAANEHQDDPARDYFGLYLWVNAYLLYDGHQSKITAGRLRRLIPFANPAERKKMTGDRARFDDFEITLNKARQGLQGANDTVGSGTTQYEILKDAIERVVILGVDADIDEQQLRALLAKAALEHREDDRGVCGPIPRIRIEAYLMKAGHRSSIPAGRLERVLPIANPEELENMKVDPSKFDAFEITLDESRRSLR